MSGTDGESHAVTKSGAKRIWLHAQRLDALAPFGDGAEATRAAVEHLGYVQIDTINVIERCHHHILYTRIPGYRREDLRRAQSIDKTVFEYWTHALSYVPTRDIRFSLGAMMQYRRSPFRWLGEQGGPAKGPRPHPQRRGPHHPRYRGRRAAGQRPSLGQPQTVEAGAAARLLHRRADDQRAGRHAQDIRPDGPALRVGRAAAARRGETDCRIPARPGAPVARFGQPRFRLLSGCAAQAGG
jgi:Winged helix DNA-binding domain